MLEQGREQPCAMHRLVTGRVKYLDLPWNKVLIQTRGPDLKWKRHLAHLFISGWDSLCSFGCCLAVCVMCEESFLVGLTLGGVETKN